MAGGDRPYYAALRCSYSECQLEASPAVATDAKRAKKKLHTATGDDDSASDLVNDKVLVESTKKELPRIQAELSSTNRNLNLAWCDEHGDRVINAAKKEFKEQGVCELVVPVFENFGCTNIKFVMYELTFVMYGLECFSVSEMLWSSGQAQMLLPVHFKFVKFL
ncbi:hypothetical protein ABZP36_036253 [Zizania latifolia]